MRATQKKKALPGLPGRKETWLIGYYAMLNARGRYEEDGDTGMTESIDRFLAACLERLCMFRAQEIMGT